MAFIASTFDPGSPAHADNRTAILALLERVRAIEPPVAATSTRAGPAHGAARVEVEIDGHRYAFELLEQQAAQLLCACDGVEETLDFLRTASTLWFQLRGRSFEVEDRTYAPARVGDAQARDGRVRAAMSGRVVAVLARCGDEVEAGQPLVTLEAMKMEHVHGAPRRGKVIELPVSAGEQVAARAVVAVIE